MQTGQILKGCYRVIRQLNGGVGGFADVYRVEHTTTHRQYAMKVPAFNTPDMEAQFQKEVNLLKALLGLNHPNLVRYHDDFVEGGVHYLIMDLAKGESLQTMLDSGVKFTEEQAINIILQILSGLKVAHSINIVHRDIKPANIIYDGTTAVLVDFGIARSQGAGGTTQLLVYGARTMYFSAPEQPQMVFTPEPRLDIYSVGVTLYHLITRRATEVFPDEPIRRLIDPIDPVKPLTGVTSVLQGVLTKSTAAKPADRHQTVDLLIQDLNRAKIVSLTSSHRSIDFGRVGWNTPKTTELTLSVVSGTPKELRYTKPDWVTSIQFVPDDKVTYPKKVKLTARSGVAYSANLSGDLVLTYDGNRDLRIPLTVEFGEAPPDLTIRPDRIDQVINRNQAVLQISLQAINEGGRLADGSGVVRWGQNIAHVTGLIKVSGDNAVLTVDTSLHFKRHSGDTFSNAIVFEAYDRPQNQSGAKLIYTKQIPVTIRRR